MSAKHPHHHAHVHPHDHSHDLGHGHDHGGACCDGHASAPAAGAALAAAVPTEQGVKTPIRILQMDCPTEEALLRSKLGGMAGVAAMEFNLMQRVLTVTHTPAALTPILAAVRALGFTPEVADGTGTAQAASPASAKPLWPLILAGIAAMASEAAQWAGLAGWVTAALAVLAVLGSGLSTYKKGWIAIRNLNLNINALMSIAVTGALLIGQWPEAAMVMVLFTIAELIEAKSLDRARNAIQSLLHMAPAQATQLQADGRWAEVPAKGIAVGARIRVKPGERIALDGTIVKGSASINQAPITGESLPVEKSEGDAVFAGTINTSHTFEFVVTAAAEDSTLSRIIHAVEAAQGTRAPTQRFVDQFSRIYTPTVFAIACVVAIAPPLLLGAAWLTWVYKALVMLVIACPCALVISTPVTIVSGLAAAARRGILIKGGVYLEKAHQIRAIALDKTGTITEGKPTLVATELTTSTVPEWQVLQWAAAMATQSDHPVSKAIARSLDTGRTAPPDTFSALPGRGVQAQFGTQVVVLGSHRLIEERGVCSPAIEALLAAHETQGRTVTLLASATEVLAVFAVADTIKTHSREALRDLQRLGVVTVMLTGDNDATAQAIARQAGLQDARANLLPQDKLDAVQDLQRQYGMCVMVGDGINDAPALARADIGIAMGAAGTDIAMETADIVIMNDDLRRIPETIRLSRKTRAVLYQNVALALGIKSVFLALAVWDSASMWMAVFADMGASLLVVANGLRLARLSRAKD